MSIISQQIKNHADRIRRRERRDSNVTINLVKAHAILLVVSRHFGGGGIIHVMNNWLLSYSYLILLFTFVSGYLYKEDFDDVSCPVYIRQKTISILLPYFKWNFIYLLLTTLLNTIDFVHYGDNISLYSLFIRPWTDQYQTFFMVPGWYLPILFIATIALFLLRKTLKKAKILNEYALLAFTLLIAGISVVLTQHNCMTGVFRSIPKAGYILPALQMGIVFKKHEKIFYRNKPLSIGIIMILIYLVNLLPSEQPVSVSILSARFIGNPITLVAWSALSVLLTVIVCEGLSPAFKNSRIIKFVGENTFSVMIHHLLVLFLINSALYGLSRVINIDFRYDDFINNICYVYPWRDSRIYLLYTLLGVAVPVFIKLLHDRLLLNLDEKLPSNDNC